MPTAALTYCAQPGCSTLVTAGRCVKHQRPTWQHRASRQERGYGSEHERNRRAVLREEDYCGICGGPGLPDDVADHIVPLARGGSGERTNMQRAHRMCNHRKGGRIGGLR